MTEAPGLHAPPWQVSDCVQALLSVHGSPFGFDGYEHSPVVGLHAAPSANWHWPGVAQVLGFAPVQTPAWQEELSVQRSESVQPVPSSAVGLEHVPVAGSQVPAT
jgi:hypothetical protein